MQDIIAMSKDELEANFHILKEGAYRIVYDLDQSMVIKYEHYGVCNRTEFRLWNNETTKRFVPKVYATSEGHEIMIVERVSPLNSKIEMNMWLQEWGLSEEDTKFINRIIRSRVGEAVAIIALSARLDLGMSRYDVIQVINDNNSCEDGRSEISIDQALESILVRDRFRYTELFQALRTITDVEPRFDGFDLHFANLGFAVDRPVIMDCGHL